MSEIQFFDGVINLRLIIKEQTNLFPNLCCM